MKGRVRSVGAPTGELAAQAKVAAQALEEILRTAGATVVLHADAASQQIALSGDALELLAEILAHLANGHGVAVYPVATELTTQQAAEMLNVSRPYLVRLLEQGKLPYHKVGTHRRIQLSDLLAFMRQDREARRGAIDLLATMAQEDGDY